MSCPICKNSAIQDYRPFCSKRCADIDLGKWMTGQYAVPSHGEDDADELLEELDRAAHSAPDQDPSKLH